MRSLFKFLSIGVLIISASSAAYAGPSKEIRDWYVYCDEVLECTMQTSAGNDIYSLGFVRAPTADSEAVFYISTSVQPDNDGILRIMVQGDQSAEFELRLSEAEAQFGTFRFPGKNVDQSLVGAMMAGASLEVSLSSAAGQATGKASLSGVTGAALFMDEAQARIGDRDALQAKGEGEPTGIKTRISRVPGASDLPESVAVAWRKGPNQCAEGRDENHDLVADMGGFKVALSPQTSIYILPCGLPGAYNFPQTVFLYDVETGNSREPAFPSMGQKGPTITDFLFNMDWDDKRSALSAFYKGRGLGDCGTRQVWEWPQGGDYYSNFELVEEYVKDECDGKDTEWPQIWPPN